MSIEVICHRPSHQGNIGAVARAMKVCELSQLHLIEPKESPNDEAYDRATNHAHHILRDCSVHQDLHTCVSEFDQVYAFTNRPRDLTLPFITVEQAALQIAQYPAARIGLLFGPERTGLTNNDCLLAHHCVTIPTPGLAAMNLSHAVQTALYVIRHQPTSISLKKRWPSAAHKQAFFDDLDQRLHACQFYHPDRIHQTKAKLVSMFQRMDPSHDELQMLHGLITTLNTEDVP